MSKTAKEIKEELDNPFNKGGYKFDDKHFVVGNEIHAETYYYVRNYFQDSRNATNLAKLFVNRIENEKIDLTNTTIVGVGIYCELFLYEVIKSFNQADDKINFCLIDNSLKEPNFYFEPRFNENVIIVFGISCTFESIVSIVELLKLQRVNISNIFFSVFVIVDSNLKIETKINSEDIKILDTLTPPNLDLFQIYKAAKWERYNNRSIFFSGNNYTCHYLISLDTKIYLAENCPFCFPKDLTNEYPLFPTRSNHDTPDLVYRLPSFANSEGVYASNVRFDKLFHKRDSGHLFGHFVIETNSYLHFIKREQFYRNNRKDIYNFFSENLRKIYKKARKELRAENQEPQIILVTQSHHKGAELFYDLFRNPQFKIDTRYSKLSNENPIKFIYVNPHEEFIENFITDFRRMSNGKKVKVIYFDYIISAGKHFKIISDFLRIARGDESKGFDYIFSIIDRTNKFSKEEILRKLDSNQKNEDKFFAFFKLNVPLFDALNVEHPIIERTRKVLQILTDCHLDELKIAFSRDLKAIEGKNLRELEIQNKLYSTPKRKKNLLKLQIAHLISEKISLLNDEENKFDLLCLKKLVYEITNDIYNQGNCTDTKTDTPTIKTILGKEEIADQIIKVLSYPPFSYYRKIYQSVFSYITAELDSVVDKIAYNGYLIQSLEEKQRLEFFLKRSVIVNSNYIISHKFLFWLKNFYTKSSVTGHKRGRIFLLNKYFILKCYKELIFKNFSRSIKLEELLNSPDLLPLPVKYPAKTSMKDALQDQFYYMGRILKTENIYIYYLLKNYFNNVFFKKNSQDRYEEDKFKKIIGTQDEDRLEYTIHQELFGTDNQNQKHFSIKALDKFLSKSKHSQEQEMSEIRNAISRMLKTVYYIKSAFEVEHKDTLQYINQILKSACGILGNNFNYSFCVEYYNQDQHSSSEYAENIYVINSNNINSGSRLRKDGIIAKMIKGIYSKGTESANPIVLDTYSCETLLAFVRDSNQKFSSFYKDFFTSYQLYSDIDDEIISSNKETINSEFIQRDIFDGLNGVIDPSANIILLFRLAEFDYNNTQKLSGRAVFAIYNTEDSNTQNFIRMLNVEKVRLLLLIKEDFIEYMRNLLTTNTLWEIINKNEERKTMQLMEHGVSGYFKALEYLIEEKKKKSNSDFSLTLMNFLKDKIYTHIRAINLTTINPEKLINLTPKKYFCHKINELDNEGPNLNDLILFVMKVPGLAERNFEPHTVRVFFSGNKSFECHPIIYDQIFPEIILNIRKYGKANDFVNIEIKIEINDDKIVFINEYDHELIEEAEVGKKEKGGIAMSSKILEILGLSSIKCNSLKDADNYFVKTIVNFKN